LRLRADILLQRWMLHTSYWTYLPTSDSFTDEDANSHTHGRTHEITDQTPM
jgi:hypothetical protein